MTRWVAQAILPAVSVLLWALAPAEAPALPQPVTITVLATTDLHGNLYPIDYVTDRPAARGLAKIATLIRQERAQNPNSILIDCGDTIQGSPLESVYQSAVRSGSPAPSSDPMMLAMNALDYAAMAVGNHEYNYGLKNLDRARGVARFPWISANTSVAPGGSERPFAAYLVKTIGGVKVAIIGITTPAVPTWEKPENLGAYRFESPIDAVRRTLVELRAREHPDLVLVAAHSGLGRGEDQSENVVQALAEAVPEIDAIVFGHSHLQLAEERIGNVLVTQPKNWGISLARIDFTLEPKPAGGWTVAGKHSRLIPVTDQTAAAADILAIARPYHEMAEQYLNTPVARSSVDLSATHSRVEDTAVVDAIQQAQLYYAKADVSFTSSFNPRASVPRGQVTVRQIAALYPYDNELYAIEGTGGMVKDALENAARYFLSCQGARCRQQPLINRDVLGFNYDIAQGVDYEIDLTQPEGSRVRNLRWHGKPLAADQKLRIAINNYRVAGSAGYGMFRGANVVWRSQEEIRDLMVRYYTERKQLPVKPDGNWRIVPQAARQTLEKEADQDARREMAQ